MKGLQSKFQNSFRNFGIDPNGKNKFVKKYKGALHVIVIVSLLFLNFSCNTSGKKNTLAMVSDRNIQDDKLLASIARGEEIYMDFCMNCHMADGKGVGRTYPPLADSDYLKEKPEESIRGIKYGMEGKIVVNGQTYNNAMMPMGLEDEEVADVMNYINNSWGNKNKTLITAEQVSKVEK